MMGWCIAGPNRKRRSSKRRLTRGFFNAVCNCIRTRPRLFTARTVSVKERIRIRSLIFLGYTFRPRLVKNRKRNSMFVNFTPAVSKIALKSMRQTTRKRNFRNWTNLDLADIARLHDLVLRGWLGYYGKFCRSAMYPVLRHFNMTLVAWAMKKFKRLRGRKIRASCFLKEIAQRQPYLFVHWKLGTVGEFA